MPVHKGEHPFRKIVESAGTPRPGSILARRAKAFRYYDEGVALLKLKKFPEAIAKLYDCIVLDSECMMVTPDVKDYWAMAVQSVTSDVNEDQSLPPLLRIQRRVFVAFAYQAVPNSERVVPQVYGMVLEIQRSVEGVGGGVG